MAGETRHRAGSSEPSESVSLKSAQSGFRLISIALLLSAASAAASASSAAAFVAAYELRSSPLTVSLNYAASLLLLSVFALVAAYVFLLLVGFARVNRTSLALGVRLARSMIRARLILAIGTGAIAVSGLFWLSALFTRGGPFGATPALVAAAVGAVALLASVALPAVTVPMKTAKLAGWVAVILGCLVVIGELVLSLRPSGATTPDWVTMGGFPLVHFNVPFGALGTIGALTLWWAYRSLADGEKSLVDKP